MWFGGGSRRSRDSNEGGGGAQAILMLVALVFIILSPILAQLIYFALSRRREYLADASGAMYTRWPEGLAAALEKLGGNTQAQTDQSQVTAPMYIVRPLKARRAAQHHVGVFHASAAGRTDSRAARDGWQRRFCCLRPGLLQDHGQTRGGSPHAGGGGGDRGPAAGRVFRICRHLRSVCGPRPTRIWPVPGTTGSTAATAGQYSKSPPSTVAAC